jgi:NAD(P)-dependent dehydrogenase (short-subunit alcohol dehydrogenase family)
VNVVIEWQTEPGFSGSTFVVTGALGAMGRTQVARLCSAGAVVRALDLAELESREWDVFGSGTGDVIPHSIDVRSEESWARVAHDQQAAWLL